MRIFQLVNPGDPGFAKALGLIRSTYAKAFHSEISPRPTLVLTLSESGEGDQELLACVTLSAGDERPFFSEHYFHEPAESAFSRALGGPVDRNQILEVGGLAATRNGAGKDLVSHTPWFVLGLGYRFGLVTATRQVRHLLSKAGMEFLPIAAADRAALPQAPDRLSLLHAVRVIRRKLPRFASLPPSGEAGMPSERPI